MILSLAVQDPPTAPQTPPPVDPDEISIEGIVVDGRPLDEAVRDGRIQRGQKVLLEGVGGGFTWGAALLEF